MKIFKPAHLGFTILCALAVQPAAANGIGTDPRTFDLNEHRVTVRLTQSSNGPLRERETRAGISLRGNIATERISNAALLRIFREEKLITNIRGWSIVMLTWDGKPFEIMLRKRGVAPVFLNLDEKRYFNIDFPESDAVSRVRGTRTINDGQLVTQGRTTIKMPGSIDFTYGPFNTTFHCSGIMLATRADESTTNSSIDGGEQTNNRLITFRLTSGSGFVTEDALVGDGVNRIGVIEGSYRFSRGVLSEIPRVVLGE